MLSVCVVRLPLDFRSARLMRQAAARCRSGQLPKYITQ
ncbi:hypothetical protein K788_0008531 [Paraburkholderia caribensis MBA4]|uniref:Uncharacterized protein n=1 Tax=Paraburkholderia caribensis MBA4 TaxID=1323664 RepID=A0A0P0REI0_9BURK|nr:hypothetical protein K788_0008531 [Paraburkholderia caribensis MBA4]